MNDAATRDPGSLAAERWPAAGIGWYAVVLLACAYVVSFIDRLMITLLVEPIKHDLALSDTQIGALQGIAFGTVYAVAGLPIGRLVDRHSRRIIVAAGIFGWTIMMIVSGLATNFMTLFIGRSGVGVGEAALSPGGLSLIADYFPPERRNRPISVFMVGATIGSGLSIIIGGTIIGFVNRIGVVSVPGIGMLKPWQLAFIIASAPGLLVVLLMFTIREPRRMSAIAAGHRPTLGDFGRFLRARSGAYGLLIAGMSINAISAYAFGTWIPTFFIRVHGWSVADVAYRYGPLSMLCSAAAMLGGGALADRLVRRGRAGAHAILITCAVAASIVPAILAPQVASVQSALALTLLFNFLGSVPFGLSVAGLVTITPNEFRGQIVALYLCCISVTGFGVGPVAVGLLNDRVSTNPLAIGHSLGLVAELIVPVAAFILLLAIRPFAAAHRQARTWDRTG